MSAVVVPFEGGSFHIRAPGRPGMDKVFEPLRHLDCRRSSMSTLRSSLTEIALDNRLNGKASIRCMSSPIANNCTLEPKSSARRCASFFVDLTAKTVHRIDDEVVPLSSRRPTKKTKLSVESMLKADRLLAEAVVPGEVLKVEVLVHPPKCTGDMFVFVVVDNGIGERMTIPVMSSYPIYDVMSCIESAGGPPPHEQKLFNEDHSRLDPSRTIADYNIRRGETLYLSRVLCGGMHHESSGHKDYCSLLWPQTESEKGGTHTVYPCIVMYLAGGERKNISAFVSDAITPGRLLAMIEMETDPTFFTSLTPSQLKAIPQGAVETLSRAALVRMNRALAEAV
eukprot:TRINITY_DN336_c0_g1_i3.p1 TRINITY_DN336_c0_g1~~TRINITY_DN336_c0_g1_i3.p1  ORF type:complete len:348 (-),score=53.85 TRINITY_DN336_c0_g1_i3:167-1183(-)